ncbi:MAG TPA: hypothetical protein VFP39_10425 [Gemmatimonadales bacterium]|nr:hypothetical protein [Gemmatimonadales bacterium]
MSPRAGFLLLGALLACSGSTGPAPPSRSYRMGFSAIPPRNDLTTVLQGLNLWTSGHADAAIMHVSVPYAALLNGISVHQEVDSNELGLANYYHAKGLPLVITVDVTNGLNRAAEDPVLDSLGRSITDTAIQHLYVDYVLTLDTILHPSYLGLAAETNLIRSAAPDSVYQAVVAMTNRAATRLHGLPSSPPLYVSVQVEVAWGALQHTGYAGIAQDFADFSFVDAIGLSSYPYLGGFTVPESLPLDYYARVVAGHAIPTLVVEGGWTSASFGPVVSSPAIQARYLDRQSRLLDSARSVAVFQLMFADLDLSSPTWPPSVLPFAHLGVVDSAFGAKPALAVWDSLMARRRIP